MKAWSTDEPIGELNLNEIRIFDIKIKSQKHLLPSWSHVRSYHCVTLNYEDTGSHHGMDQRTGCDNVRCCCEIWRWVGTPLVQTGFFFLSDMLNNVPLTILMIQFHPLWLGDGSWQLMAVWRMGEVWERSRSRKGWRNEKIDAWEEEGIENASVLVSNKRVAHSMELTLMTKPEWEWKKSCQTFLLKVL